ncbi:MAG TPA: fimbrial protein [Scandinavium sp.]
MTLNKLSIMMACIFSASTFAADSVNINVTGTVVASPCTVNNSNANLSVDLGNIQATTLLAPASSSPKVDFQLLFTNCPKGTSNVVVTFSGTNDSVAKQDFYQNTGTAANVAVGIETSTGAMKGNGTSITQSIDPDGTATIDMKAKAYSSAGGALPGSISAAIVATMQYN